MAMGGYYSLVETKGDLPKGARKDVQENGASFYKTGSKGTVLSDILFIYHTGNSKLGVHRYIGSFLCFSLHKLVSTSMKCVRFGKTKL